MSDVRERPGGVQGRCDDRFATVRDAFAANLASGEDVGASVAITIDGELVVDLWGGHRDAARTQPWTDDTLVNVWSSTKTMTALSALVLADRGELDLDAPVAEYWPEFAAAGKDGVLVRHLLSHTSGLSAWAQPVTPADVYDWERSIAMLAAQAPWWEPGTMSGYHALSQGHLVGEVVRRVSGVSLGTFFRTEIAEPLGADFHIGLAPEHDDRVSFVIPNPPMALDALPEESIMFRTFTGPRIDATAPHDPAWRRAELPAVNGHGNARSMALVQSVVAGHGEARGTRLLSAETCERIFEVQASGTDLVLGVPLRLGIGYGITGAETPLSPNSHTCFWGGWGGSLVVNDLDNRMCFTYAMNRMGDGTLGDTRGVGLLFAAYAALG